MERDPVLRDLHDTLASCRQLSVRVQGHSKRHQADWDAVREEVESICSRMETAATQVTSLPEDHAQKSELMDAMADCQHALQSGPGGDLRKFTKRVRNPLVLSMLLGRHSTVVAVRKDEALRIKREYHSFRSRMAVYMLLFCSVIVYLMQRARAMTGGLPPGLADSPGDALGHHTFHPVIMAAFQVFLVFMIYVYIAFAARESVLLMNGSNIRSWWIVHHYCSALACIVTLALPVDSQSVQGYARSWLLWTMGQAVLILAQNRYQQQRMYTRVALGKDSAMDVVGGETSGVQGQLLMLLPLLFGLQAWQMALGFSMAWQSMQAVVNTEGWLEMERHESDLRGLRGTCIVGLILASMGVMNLVNTVGTMRQKLKAGVKSARRSLAQ